jgi:hypothetical protein
MTEFNMKTFNKILIAGGLVVTSLAMGSCTNDLDLLPTDPNTTTAAVFGDDPEGYMDAVMGDVYLQFATYGANGNASVSGFDGGMSTFQRAVFILEEIPTDEASWLPTADVDYGDFQYGIVPANNRAVMGTYSRFMINVALCNDFIQTVNNGYFNLTDDLKAKADEYIRQCKTLRSACYFYLIDCFGDVPYADENVAIGSVPEQLPRAEIFEKVTSTLEDVIAEYGSNPSTPSYGYIGKDAAEAILVKYYLNAEVYTGTAQWDKCYQHAKAIIDRHQGEGFQGSGLCQTYNQLFAYSNKRNAPGGGGVNEILWTIPQNEPNLKSYANGTFMVNAWISASKADDSWQLSLADYNATNGWKCMVARRQFVEKFDWDANYEYSDDQRVAYWRTAAHGFSIDNPVLDQDHYGSNGFLAVKFTNFAYDENGNLDIDNTPVASDQLPIDYPVIRLAEMYLSAAEAILHGAGDKAEALKYVNLIRERAGLNAWNAGELTYETLQDERCRELYTENCRRTDLIRYGKWISGYTWNWKNKVAAGGNFSSSFALYPLPSSIVTLAGYKQNTGY